jgi:ferrous iron transport protein A
MDLGFVPGSEIRPLFAAPMGDPRAYLVCDTVIALRQRDAAAVAVEAI